MFKFVLHILRVSSVKTSNEWNDFRMCAPPTKNRITSWTKRSWNWTNCERMTQLERATCSRRHSAFSSIYISDTASVSLDLLFISCHLNIHALLNFLPSLDFFLCGVVRFHPSLIFLLEFPCLSLLCPPQFRPPPSYLQYLRLHGFYVFTFFPSFHIGDAKTTFIQGPVNISHSFLIDHKSLPQLSMP